MLTPIEWVLTGGGGIVCAIVGYSVVDFIYQWFEIVASRIKIANEEDAKRPASVRCVDCGMTLAHTLQTFPEFGHQPLCFGCLQKRRKAVASMTTTPYPVPEPVRRRQIAGRIDPLTGDQIALYEERRPRAGIYRWGESEPVRLID